MNAFSDSSAIETDDHAAPVPHLRPVPDPAPPRPAAAPETWPCTATVTLTCDRSEMPAFLRLPRAPLGRFRTLDGPLGGALLLGADGTRLITRLKWRRRAHHEACIADPMWDTLPESVAFQDRIAAGLGTLVLDVYVSVAATGPARPSGG